MRVGNKEIVPIKKEFSFVLKLVFAMVVSAIITLAILYLFLSKNIGASYRAAFQSMSTAYEKLNIYVIAAILVQLIFSSLVIYFTALYFSHKIAGPMYRLKMVLQEYMKGADTEKVTFRRTDFIPGVSRLFTNFFTFLGKRKRLIEEAESLAAQLSQKSGEEKAALLKRLEALMTELAG